MLYFVFSNSRKIHHISRALWSIQVIHICLESESGQTAKRFYQVIMFLRETFLLQSGSLPNRPLLSIFFHTLFIFYLPVGVLDRRALNQLVKMCCMPLIPDGDAKRHKVYTGSGNGALCPVRECSCIPCTGVLVVGGYKLSERGSSSQVSAERNAGYRVRHIARMDVREPT